jgi:amino acid transporter
MIKKCEFSDSVHSISILGLVVLGGHTRVPDPTANFRNAFEGTTNSGYGITNALVKVMFAYSGYTNAMNVVNEVRVSSHPSRTDNGRN